ncbi:MAG: hypothetical protein IT464_15680 [Planctomycetes bacterium]|nr:hypothetical protein [Planctomycetota bacterium]
MRDSGGDQAEALKAQVEEIKKELTDTKTKLSQRHEHVAKLAPELDSAKKENEKLKARIAELEKASSTEKLRVDMDIANAEAARTKAQNALEQAHTDLHSAQEERKALAKEVKELRAKLDEVRDEQKSESEGIGARVAELERELAAERERAGEFEAQAAELPERDRTISRLQEELQDARAETATARNSQQATEDELKDLRSRLAQAEKGSKAAEDAEARLAARDRQIEVAQQQLADLKEEIKLEEEERNRATQQLQQAREAEQRAMEQTEALEAEVEELRKRAEAAERAGIERAAQLEGGLKEENERLKARNEEITRKRDDVLKGLEAAAGEVEELKALIAERDVEKRTLQAERDKAIQEAEDLRTLQAEITQLDNKHKEMLSELARVGHSLTNSETAAEKAREEVRMLREKVEQASERRHEAEKQLVEARAKLESELHMRGEQAQRIRQLEESLQRERDTVDQSAPASALETLSSQLAVEREKWERVASEKEREIEDVRKQLNEAELRENDLASQLEGIELSKQDVMRAKALAGQRRAQIERMQSDVEGARRKATEAETYWKTEMDDFRGAVAEHLEAAERGDEGSDQKLQKLLETLKVGIADKYAKLRRKHTRTEKELQETTDKLTAIERILAKREEEEVRLRKIVEELEARENVPGARKKAKEDADAKAAPKKKATRKGK